MWVLSTFTVRRKKIRKPTPEITDIIVMEQCNHYLKAAVFRQPLKWKAHGKKWNRIIQSKGTHCTTALAHIIPNQKIQWGPSPLSKFQCPCGCGCKLVQRVLWTGSWIPQRERVCVPYTAWSVSAGGGKRKDCPLQCYAAMFQQKLRFGSWVSHTLSLLITLQCPPSPVAPRVK